MYEGWEWDYYGMTRSPTKDFDRIDQAKGHLRELDHRIHLAKDELSYLVDEHGNLKIDAFALRTNEINQGMHVFNFGYSP
jgi:hypothetical protein